MFASPLIIAGLLLLTTGCNSANVPNVVGQQSDYAKGVAEGQGFVVETTEAPGAGVPAGQVLAQDPVAGSTATKGSVVKLTLASGYELRGVVKLVDVSISGGANDCSGNGGFSDIRGGMTVTVKDGQGNIIGTGQSENGTREPGASYNFVCRFQFTVRNIPRADFYSVEAGHRGATNFSFAEMEEKKWTVEFTI
jgi:PASTA domain